MNRYGPGGRFGWRELEQYGRDRQEQELGMDGGQARVKDTDHDHQNPERDEQRASRDKRDYGMLNDYQAGWKPNHYPARNPPVGHGVYLFIRFPGHSAEFAAQAVVLGKRCVRAYRGDFVGIARKIHELSTDPRQSESLIMYLFESQHGAERFFVSDPRFKQPDFPPDAGACEAWTTVKFRDTQDQEFYNYHAYMLCYTNLESPSFYQYREQVNAPLGQLIEDYGGIPFVVQNVGVCSLRRHHTEDNTMVTLHFFRHESDIYNMMTDPRYKDIKRRQHTMAKDVTSVFTADPEACP